MKSVAFNHANPNLKLNTFKEWDNAVHNELRRFADIKFYLNDEGIAYYEALSRIVELACFCDTAREFICLFNEEESFPNYHTVAHIIACADRISRDET